MKLLAIDAATEALSVAVQYNNDIIDRFEVCPQQHSQKLLPLVDEVMSEAGLTLQQLDGLVFGRGPGSFTGVRIATGMVQGLAFGAQLPVVGISTLAAMAQQAINTENAHTMVSAIDARMSEVYFAQFAAKDGLAVGVGGEQVCAPDIAASMLPESAFHAVGTGWQAYEALQGNDHQAVKTDILYPHARFMLQLAAPEFAAGNTQDAMSVMPVYLRDKVTWKKLPGRE
ncbi:tRNA (adenosine(37)-N6)-threonylcarbamoyltransferase complex dimerization subunit type 1 TsaB [Salinimonas sp. HHU 13199]|uniref:tRNA threonylcarbamoyladenosine biosynthesis protein TsaB n=1 Tax=Salinimonas profundi TaxID=2729140 RepID=A0ABR8LQP9_9ALTE|nr:tRNA (adenosine(37)-N6)-threonylcarbamoyltransferase complex dimerization subunit type 1 TsaB [Salinimonas profundi]MBD3587391.1 tRNA (adenosine(37)-N6)-threonylcarbamoyltransferase complex dimerization subunit type 1 TsaB [Salinimonas profundi]